MYLTERSSPFDPGFRPSNSSDDRTLMCSRIDFSSIFGKDATGTCTVAAAGACCAGAGLSVFPLHAAAHRSRAVMTAIRFMESLYCVALSSRSQAGALSPGFEAALRGPPYGVRLRCNANPRVNSSVTRILRASYLARDGSG